MARLEASLPASDGDLGEAARTLVALPEAWQPLRKLASQQDYAVAVLRGIAAGEEGVEPLLNRLGAFRPAAVDAACADRPARQGAELERAGAADAPPRLGVRPVLRTRRELPARAPEPVEPPELFERLRGPLAPEEVRLAVARAPSRREGSILALAHPGMHRR